MLVDVKKRGLTGKQCAEILDHAGITVNKNAIPFDTESPFKTSGVRLGTPAVTTRGMKEDQMKLIAGWINTVLTNPESESKINSVKGEVQALTKKFPLYPNLEAILEERYAH
jgi:glycine hydroxymethyltransferase